MPIISTLAGASARGYGLGSLVQTSTGAYESIASTSVGSGGSAYVEFTSIPSTYTHLQIRAISRADAAVVWNEDDLTFNSDTGSNYSNTQAFGTGTSIVSDAEGTRASIYLSYRPGASASSSIFGVYVCDILDYKNTNKYKSTRTFAGTDNNNGGYVLLRSGLWLNTNAITSIKIAPRTGNFVQYSQFALYGIRESA